MDGAPQRSIERDDAFYKSVRRCDIHCSAREISNPDSVESQRVLRHADRMPDQLRIDPSRASLPLKNVNSSRPVIEAREPPETRCRFVGYDDVTIDCERDRLDSQSVLRISIERHPQLRFGVNARK